MKKIINKISITMMMKLRNAVHGNNFSTVITISP